MTERDRYHLTATWTNLETNETKESTLGFRHREDVVHWAGSRNREVTRWNLRVSDACGDTIATAGDVGVNAVPNLIDLLEVL